MKIAILVWGSLYWDKRDLATTNEWFYDGPQLPIEFARISSGNRLTLVLKPNFDTVATLYAVSSFTTLSEAQQNLKTREGTDNINNIGFIDFTTGNVCVKEGNTYMLSAIREWNQVKKFDAVIWSDFSPNFQTKTKLGFTSKNLCQFLSNLPKSEFLEAKEYILKTPKQIQTRYRNELEVFCNNHTVTEN